MDSLDKSSTKSTWSTFLENTCYCSGEKMCLQNSIPNMYLLYHSFVSCEGASLQWSLLLTLLLHANLLASSIVISDACVEGSDEALTSPVIYAVSNGVSGYVEAHDYLVFSPDPEEVESLVAAWVHGDLWAAGQLVCVSPQQWDRLAWARGSPLSCCVRCQLPAVFVF